MKRSLPGYCREACVFAPTRHLAPTRRQHQAARMKQVCIHVLTKKNTYYIWYFFMNLTAYDYSTIQYFNCHPTQRNFYVLFIHYLNLLFMLYIHFVFLYITIKMYRLSWISLNNKVQKKASEPWEHHLPSKQAQIFQTISQEKRKTNQTMLLQRT